jgi:Ran GTPase-activating protein (RanGAP) involved in mRNA processing and transport
MRPEIPPWLEETCQRLSNNDKTLKSVEITHQRIDDAGARALSRALEENTHVTCLILSCFSMVDDGAFVLGNVFGKSKTLKKLQLRDLRHSRELTYFLHALKENSSIEELSFRHCHFCVQSSNGLGSLLQNSIHIEELRLVDTQIVGRGLAAVCDGLRENRSVQRLYLVNNELGAFGAQALGSMLSTNQSLRELYICENQIGDEGTIAIAHGLEENVSLCKLDLRSNGIGLDGAFALRDLIMSTFFLTGLFLGTNELGNVGAAVICQGLRLSLVLRQLDLSNNGLDSEGADPIAWMLRYNHSLTELNLSFNSVGDEGAVAISGVLEHNMTLKWLSLRRNCIGNDGAKAFARRLPTMRSLKELILVKNTIDHEGRSALLDGLRFNMELECLHVEDQNVSEPIVREIIHWISLNRAGRRIFRHTNLPNTLWPRVLARINRDLDVLHHFLIEKPDMLAL